MFLIRIWSLQLMHVIRTPTVNYTETVDGQFCDPQVITRTWRAEDDCGNFSVVVQKIYVTDDSPPMVINPPQDLTINCTQMPPAIPMLQIQDDCGNGNINVDLQEFETGKLCDDLLITRIWTITDDCSNKIVVTQEITITDDLPPTITGPDDLTVDCADVPTLEDPIFDDDCDKDLDIQYQEMSIPGNCPFAYTIMRTWKATDDCGNVTTKVQNVSVLDTQGSRIGLCPSASGRLTKWRHAESSL